MTFVIVKHSLLASSFTTLILSLIFLFLPRLYSRLEEILSIDVLPETVWLTALEGQINFINDWIFKNRIAFGMFFVMSSLYNIRIIVSL